MIIPGLDGITSFFQDIIPELTVNHHVLLFHLPWKNAAIEAQEYSFDMIASHLHKVIASELPSDAQVSLVGESFGGVVAQTYTLQHPEKVSKLVLLSSLAKTELTDEVLFKLKYVLPPVEFLGTYLHPFLAQALFAVVHSFDVIEPSEPFWARLFFIREAMFAHFPSVAARVAIVSHVDIREKVRHIQQPTLIVYGEDDTFTKPLSEELLQLLPHSQSTTLKGGHLCHITHPKEFSSLVLDFVGEK